MTSSNDNLLQTHLALEAAAWERVPPVPACPAWCTRPEGHAYEGLNDVHTPAFFRLHSTHAEGALVWLTQVEMNAHGAVVVEPVEIEATNYDGASSLDAASARTVAAELLAAADRLDTILAATT